MTHSFPTRRSADLRHLPGRAGKRQRSISGAAWSFAASIFPVGKQSQRIEHDKQCRSFMGHDRRTDPESQDRRWYEQGDHADAANQVLPDDPAGAAAQPYGKRKMPKVVGPRPEQHRVGKEWV